jgi:Glycosyl transferases group 1
VVASAVGGLVDTVVDGVTGAHVPPRRPRFLAATLAALLADPPRRAALGAAGARRARRRYGWDRIARSTLEVYTSLPAEVPAGRPAGRRAGHPAGRQADLPAGRPTGLRAGGPADLRSGGSAGLPAEAVDSREHPSSGSATLPLRGASQPEVGFARAPDARAPKRQSRRGSR